jgi:hypothetical protein
MRDFGALARQKLHLCRRSIWADTAACPQLFRFFASETLSAWPTCGDASLRCASYWTLLTFLQTTIRVDLALVRHIGFPPSKD